ncbi:MAG: hypothetical protein R3C01_11990 [Planctomycetaceae bacterium]
MNDIDFRENDLRDHPAESLAAIEREVLHHKRQQKKPRPALTILEAGLWSVGRSRQSSRRHTR